MIPARGYAAQNAQTPLAPFTFERRDPGDLTTIEDPLALQQIRDLVAG